MIKINNGFLTIPVAILLAGVIIAAAIIYAVGFQATPQGQTTALEEAFGNGGSGGAEKMRPIDPARDHILGSPEAPVKLVIYEDMECPFCKRFAATAEQVTKEYGDQVALVSRHFPLDSLHSKARREAAALELTAELGGPPGSEASNDAFWKYRARLFEITPSNDGLDLNLLAQIAQDVGLPKRPFEDLVKENDIKGGKFAQRIEEDYQDATATGGQGTPHSIVTAANGKKFVVSGAQPLEALKQVIDLALKK